MNNAKFLNLYIYSDSLAFRRKTQSQDISFTYPFVLKELIETKLGIRVNLLLRGGGGLTISKLKNIIIDDTGFFGGDNCALNIAVLQLGIVDCAPRPLTYLLTPVLRRLSIVGRRILAILVEHRRGLQNIFSYTATPAKRFRSEYASIIYACHSVNIRALAVGMPLPTFTVEHRSPGFRRNASIYNELIRNVIPDNFCDIEHEITESVREKLLLDDGHHLSEAGHKYYAEKIFTGLKKLI